jgi:hypothetical protein
LSVEPDDLRLFDKPHLLPRSFGEPYTPSQITRCVERFHALGLGSKFNRFQNAFGIENPDLLGTAMVSLSELVAGLEKPPSQIGEAANPHLMSGDKIFVVEGDSSDLVLREVIPLLRVLRSYNRQLALLWIAQASQSENDLIGRVEWLGPRFYRGYVDPIEPVENAPEYGFEDWVKLCRVLAETFDTTRSVKPHM